MKKKLLLGTMLLAQTVIYSQYDNQGNVKFNVSKTNKYSSSDKSAVTGDCGNDTVRYAGNKAYYLQAGFNDPTTGGFSVNKQSTATNIVTTAYKVPSGGSVSVIGAEINGLMMLTNYGAISSPTISTHKVYLYTIDANNKPLVKIDSADMTFTENFDAYTANFVNGPHTLTADFAIGVKGGATSDPTHYLYVAYNQMHVSTDVTNPYGEHLSYKYQPGATPPDFIDMATNFANATYDFEFSINPIVTYNLTADFSPSFLTSCDPAAISLTNTSVGTEIFKSHSFGMGAFATRYNINEGSGAMDLPRDSIYNWFTGINTSVKSNVLDPITFTTQSTFGTYGDTLVVVSLTHNYNYCITEQIINYEILDCAEITENSFSAFSIFPNPANDVISITFSDLVENNRDIRFYAADGKLIESRRFNNSTIETFDVKSLKSGVYFFQIGNTIEKVIVN